MSTTTTNLELVKPAGNERVDVDVINSNYDKIDEFAGLAITDANYVHTDNNYTTTEKNKLSAIQPNATATSFTQTLVSGTAVGTITINGTAYTIYAPAASGGSSALNDLSDVTLASPSNGQVLKYNATTGKWENANESGGGGGYIPTGEVYTFFTDGSAAAANYTLYVQWTDGETVTTALIVSYSELISGWTTDDYQDVTINWDSSNQNFNFVAKSGSFECNGTYFDEGDTMGTLSSGNITFNAMEKEATGVDWTQVQLSGTKIAEIEIDGVSQNVYAPTPPTKTSDLTNDSNFVADASYVHTDNNYTLTEKNKLSGLVEVEANPSGTASTDLTKIAIGGTNYNIPSGGSGSSTFAGLSDVDIDDTTLANGQVPVWNSTTEKWENGAVAGGGGITYDKGYSTTEQAVCAWTDGTTVYQKTFHIAGDGTIREFTVQTGITNAKELIDAQIAGLRYDSTHQWWSPAYINIDNPSWGTTFVTSEDLTQFIIKATQYPIKNISVTLRYTKTTDIPFEGVLPIDELSDVDISNPTNGQVLTYNSTTGDWENANASGGTTVVPNPQGTPTGELLAIQIGNDIYSLPEGESEHLLNDILTGPDATKATASSTSQDGAIWKAFDGVKTGTEQSCWIPEYGSTNCWICYHFATPKYITKCHVYFYENMSGTYTGAVKIQGSNDGETWTDISQSQALSMTRGVHDYEIESTDIVNGYSYVRMFSETALVVYGSASACTLELEIYGRDNASGTTVIPNPEGEATDTLTKIQIGNDIYEIVGGGGSGFTKTTLYEISGTTPESVITLSQSIENFDLIEVVSLYGHSDEEDYKNTTMFNAEELVDSIGTTRPKNWWIGNDTVYVWFYVTDVDEFTIHTQTGQTGLGIWYVYGYKFGGGGEGSAEWTDVVGTLEAGQTQIVLTSSKIKANSVVNPYASKVGVKASDMIIANGAVTLTFPAQTEDLDVMVRVTKVDTNHTYDIDLSRLQLDKSWFCYDSSKTTVTDTGEGLQIAGNDNDNSWTTSGTVGINVSNMIGIIPPTLSAIRLHFTTFAMSGYTGIRFINTDTLFSGTTSGRDAILRAQGFYQFENNNSSIEEEDYTLEIPCTAANFTDTYFYIMFFDGMIAGNTSNYSNSLNGAYNIIIDGIDFVTGGDS